jgi:hypothetical protein
MTIWTCILSTSNTLAPSGAKCRLPNAAIAMSTGRKSRPTSGTASIRSYTYEDQNSYAHIDIGIIAGTGPSGQNFYRMAIFG